MEYEEFKETWKMRVECWKFRCQQQCFAQPDAPSTVKLVAFRIIVRQNTHCIVEADEFTRKRVEGILDKGHEDHIAGRGIKSLNHCNLLHKFYHAKAAVEKYGKTRKETGMTVDESQKQKRGDRWSKEWGQKQYILRR